MNPYAPQEPTFQQRPAFRPPVPQRLAPQFPIHPTQQQFPARQFPAQRPAQFPAQFRAQRPAPQFQARRPTEQGALPQLPTQQRFPQQRPWPSPLVRQLPALHAPLLHEVAQQPPTRRVPHPALIVAFGVLVAALVVTTVMLVRGSSAQQPVRSANTLPTPPVVLTTTGKAPPTTAPRTTAPETTAPRTTAPETTAPQTTAPQTTAPQTTAPETTAPRSQDGEAAVIRGASVAATAWARAVNNGDEEGVRTHSCRQDIRVYDSGDLTNPGQLRGEYTFTVQHLVALTGTGTAAVVRFGISPELGSLSTLDSYVTQQSGRWLVCLSVTERADL